MKSLFLRISLLVAFFFLGLETYAIDLTQMKGHYQGVETPIKALKHQLGDQAMPLKQSKMQKVSADKNLTTSIDAPGWGFLVGPDGKEWFYSQTFAVDNWYYTSSVITIYDSNMEYVGEVSAIVPEGERVNQIEPFGEITEKFFDNNSSTLEVSVYNHAVTDDYIGKMWVDVYSIDKGIVDSIDCEAALFVNASEGWNSYIRFITSTTDVNGMININVWKPGGWSSKEIVLDHTFQVEEKLVNYMDASYINTYVIDGKPYYVIPHYAKEFMQPNEDIFAELVPTEDNSLVIEVYNDEYELVKELSIPIEPKESAYFTFAGFGMFSTFDLSKGFFTGDDQLNFIVTEYDYKLENDEYRYTFKAYDESGALINTIGENAVTWLYMSPVEGEEYQVALVKTDTEYGSLEMINIPSCQRVVTLPGEIDGRMISTQIDRRPVADSYQYVIGTAQAAYDENYNIIASIGWYTKEGEVDHYVDFNLGPDGEYFSAYLSTESLNPYLMDTDSEYEYVYLSKIRNGEGLLDNYLTIANEDGSVIQSFTNDEDKGWYYSGGFVNCDTLNPSLFIAYLDENDNYWIDFYDMPFERFSAGGTGSANDPYIITSAGDLQQMAIEPAAYYELAANIDLAGETWIPIANFTGQLDGKNYVISNLKLENDENYCGFFAELNENAVVKNIVFDSPEICVGNNNYYVGTLAAITIQATIENVHALNVSISGSKDAVVGGLVANPTLYTTITGCSVQNLTIDTPNAVPVGGLCGDMRTQTVVSAGYVSGDIIGLSEVGGIAGSSGQDCSITNCHAEISVRAEEIVGGIVGSAGRNLICNNFVEGAVEATKFNMSKIASAGGVIGHLESDWTEAGTKIIVGNVSNVAIKSLKVASGVHRIVGFTIADESYEAGEEVKTELGLENNYAGETATINGNVIESDDLASVEGATIDLATTTREFYEGIGFLFGNDYVNPWKINETGLLEIFFENQALSLIFDVSELTALEGEIVELTALVYGTTDVELTVSDEEIIRIKEVVYEDNKAQIAIEILQEGSATITAKSGKLQAECIINALSEINEVEILNSNISFSDNTLMCSGAKEIAVYGINGVKTVGVKADRLSISHIDAGIYIVVVTNANGIKNTIKILKK